MKTSQTIQFLSKVIVLLLLVTCSTQVSTNANVTQSQKSASYSECPLSKNVTATAQSESKDVVTSPVRVLKTPQDVKDVFKKHDLVALKVGAEWCGACHALQPHLEGAARTFADSVCTCSLDADVESPELKNIIKALAVTGFPTVFYISSGANKKDTESAVESLLKGKKPEASALSIKSEVGSRKQADVEGSMKALVESKKAQKTDATPVTTNTTKPEVPAKTKISVN